MGGRKGKERKGKEVEVDEGCRVGGILGYCRFKQSHGTYVRGLGH